jgi:TolA-binding protein
MAKAISSKTKGHLTKKELKQDKLVEFTYKAEQFYRDHQRTVLIAAAAVVIVILGVVLVRKSVQSTRMEESYQLTLAKMNYGANRLPEAKDAFQKIVSTESGKYAGEAKYFLARIAFEQGNYADAVTDFTSYLKDYSVDDQMDCAAMSGLAAAYEAQSKNEDAVKTYTQVAEKYPQNPYAPQALLEASRIYLSLNQPDNAAKVLQQIRDKYPDSALASQAKRQLDNLQ